MPARSQAERTLDKVDLTGNVALLLDVYFRLNLYAAAARAALFTSSAR